MPQISARARDIGNQPVLVDMNPYECPICHFAIKPEELGTAVRHADNAGIATGNIVERVFLCPNERCERIFIARYIFVGRTPQNQEQFKLQSSVPVEISTPKQSANISKVSPDFCSIYEQAYRAERYGLVLVAGPGYRKGFEFLIKDYIISGFKGTDSEIAEQKAGVEKTQLAACITKYIKSEQIKEIAKRAAWLANDEVHYIRKWEDKDLNDLKKLITLTIHWIEMETLTVEVIADMPEGKP